MIKLSEEQAIKILQAMIEQDKARVDRAVKQKNSRKAFRLKRDLTKLEKLLKFTDK